jgi:hypothetical protein
MNSRLGVTATTDMAVLPCVLGCRPLRRTIQVGLSTNPAARGTVARWHTHPRCLATAIHEISGLGFFTFHAAAKFIDTVTAVKSITNLAFGHDGACIAFVAFVTCRTDKLRICHLKTPMFSSLKTHLLRWWYS